MELAGIRVIQKQEIGYKELPTGAAHLSRWDGTVRFSPRWTAVGGLPARRESPQTSTLSPLTMASLQHPAKPAGRLCQATVSPGPRGDPCAPARTWNAGSMARFLPAQAQHENNRRANRH